ncbi:hypothetical protein HYC85_026046 [Camellia sinensis]|uniref:Leucine-rich repeat-containing N-terminal plant-type domain-containing protein n=1 Tax=Camellia sinensis TaxID=4442 RepID=A0A7J7G329_CAMSI|nr:hypothetical protein HYC85_026046 [Camellia sinensis]
MLIVRVHSNCLSGSIPAGLWTSSNLTILMLSDNLFTGQLPRTLGPSLRRLDISNNKFSGELPPGLSSLKHLIVFSASNNFFSGTIVFFYWAVAHPLWEHHFQVQGVTTWYQSVPGSNTLGTWEVISITMGSSRLIET